MSAESYLVRTELSRRLPPAEAAALERVIAQRLPLTTYGGQSTTQTRTVYLDDPFGTMTRRVLARPRCTTKVRLRSYGDDGITWLERKSRAGDCVTKRRVQVEGDAVEFALRHTGLRPVAVVDYQRRAYGVGNPHEGQPQIRVTVDHNVRVGKNATDLWPLTSEWVVEAKVMSGREIPRWLRELLDGSTGLPYSKSVAALASFAEHSAA